MTIPHDPEAQRSLVLDILAKDARVTAALAALEALDLPDSWIAAGLPRSAVWDALTGRAEPTPLADVDVIFFDPKDLTPRREREAEAALRARAPGFDWSARNQARMHLRNANPPYRDCAEALTYWLETPTALAVARRGGALELLAPFGLEDLLHLRVRPTPRARASAKRLSQYHKRVLGRGWQQRWPELSIDLG
jgi:hypothetical protein